MSLEDFLDALEDLTKKTGIEIGGCGDCGSPWVTGAEGGEHLGYDTEEGYYSVSVLARNEPCNCSAFDSPHHHGLRTSQKIVRSKSGR